MRSEYYKKITTLVYNVCVAFNVDMYSSFYLSFFLSLHKLWETFYIRDEKERN